jgi:hypothetical protein
VIIYDPDTDPLQIIRIINGSRYEAPGMPASCSRLGEKPSACKALIDQDSAGNKAHNHAC